MSANYKTLADFEVATAEEAQSYFMDQAVIKVDAEVDLATLPNEVKTAYVLNTGTFWMRNVANIWVPNVGGATVSETAPANPQVGQMWVKPSEVLPAPVRGYCITSTKSVTATTWASVTSDTARSITLPKAAMVDVWLHLDMTGAAATALSVRIKWSGATTGDSYTQIGSGVLGAVVATQADRKTLYTTVACAAGTTTFSLEAQRANTTSATSVNFAAFVITPVQWADVYEAGVS